MVKTAQQGAKIEAETGIKFLVSPIQLQSISRSTVEYTQTV
jgi:hypothetical protein